MYKYLLFDLDGTLTESGEGITNAAAYAFRSLGYEVPEKTQLMTFVGPPLTESFPKFGVPESDIERAVKEFRVYFADRGWCENKPYPGVKEMCEALSLAGYKLIVATSKLETQAIRIMKYFDLDSYFTDVIGSDDAAGRSSKSEVVAYVLEKHSINPETEALMIGDRHYDVNGAAACGVKTVGVSYGYGSREELIEAGAVNVCNTVEELTTLLLGFFG